MQSCDNLLLSQMLSNITYEEIILSNGIANNIRKVNYADEEIIFPEGRGFINFLNIFNNFNITYEELSVDKVLKQNYWQDIMVICPSTFLKESNKINKKIVQFSIFYSTYKILKIEKEYITLSLADCRTSYTLIKHIDELKALENLHVKPLGFGIKIIKINDLAVSISKEKVLNNLEQSIKRCLNNFEIQYEDTICIGGEQFYSMFLQYLDQVLFLSDDSAMNRIKKYMFHSSLRSGGECFYRYDFAQIVSTHTYTREFVNQNIADALYEVAGYWRKVDVILIGKSQENNSPESKYRKIENLLKKIKKLEIEALTLLYKNIERRLEHAF